MDLNKGILTEIKYWKGELPLTQQLRDYLQFAALEGMKFRMVIAKGHTTLSPKLLREAKRLGVDVIVEDLEYVP